MFNQGYGAGYSLADIAAATGTSRNGGNDGFGWGGDGWWIILLFLFAGWGGNGWGGFGGGAGSGTVKEEIAYGFDMNGLDDNVRGVQQGLCDGFYAMNTGMLNGFGNLQNSLCQEFASLTGTLVATNDSLRAAINADTVAGMQNTNTIVGQLHDMAAANAACCCETGRAIERGFADVNYNLATQESETRRAIADSTRDIIDSNNAGVRSILDFLTQDKIAALTAENQNLKFAASQAAQNNYLVSELSPKCPIPAYVVCNPYTGQYGYPATGYGYGVGCGAGCSATY